MNNNSLYLVHFNSLVTTRLDPTRLYKRAASLASMFWAVLFGFVFGQIETVKRLKKFQTEFMYVLKVVFI